MKQRRFAFLLTFLGWITGSLPNARVHAQCESQWLPGDGIPGLNGHVFDTTIWDPDGNGPQTPRLVAAGRFLIAGAVFAQNIAVWDGLEWSPLGPGLGDGSGIDGVDAVV